MKVYFIIKTEDKITREIRKRGASVEANEGESFIDLATNAVMEIENNHPNEEAYQVFRLEETPWKTTR